MFKKLFIFILANLFLSNLASANLNVKARTAILQDFHSGEILYEKDPDMSIYPASINPLILELLAGLLASAILLPE